MPPAISFINHFYTFALLFTNTKPNAISIIEILSKEFIPTIDPV